MAKTCVIFEGISKYQVPEEGGLKAKGGPGRNGQTAVSEVPCEALSFTGQKLYRSLAARY